MTEHERGPQPDTGGHASPRTRGEPGGGPPWILGHRGAPLEAPENTLAGLRRAVELGLDGFEYDLRACATGEAVLLHDATLERTTDTTGPLRRRTLPELFGVDAGSWFDRAFQGEPLPLVGEALALEGPAPGTAPMHMIELKEQGLVDEVAHQLTGPARKLSVRIASFHRRACLEARDAGLAAMLLAHEATESDRRFVRDERLAAHCVGPGGWRTLAGSAEWSCERWAFAVDEPRDLLLACREPLFGFNTNEPLRALAVRALVALAPVDDGPYPVRAPVLEMELGAGLPDTTGEWVGSWTPTVGVRNPLPFDARVVVELRVRRGAFEVEGLPVGALLPPGGELELPLRLTGGSWRIGGDPVVAATFLWEEGPGRKAGRLTLDAPLHRIRSTVASPVAVRLPMLRERPGEGDASMTLRRHGGQLLVSIENPGGLEDASTLVHLDGRKLHGRRGLRALLPEDFDRRAGGVAFSCGMIGREDGAWCVRRWAGGVPQGLGSGAPGRLLPDPTG